MAETNARAFRVIGERRKSSPLREKQEDSNLTPDTVVLADSLIILVRMGDPAIQSATKVFFGLIC